MRQRKALCANVTTWSGETMYSLYVYSSQRQIPYTIMNQKRDIRYPNINRFKKAFIGTLCRKLYIRATPSRRKYVVTLLCEILIVWENHRVPCSGERRFRWLSPNSEYEKHEKWMKSCGLWNWKATVSDWQMSARSGSTLCGCDTVKHRRGMADDRYVMLDLG